MKNLKRNQVIIFVIALMLVTAGYLNYTTNTNINSVATSTRVNNVEEVADIGDAKLVSSNAILEQTNTESGLVSNDGMEINKQQDKEEKENNTKKEQTIQTNSKETDEYFNSSRLTRDTMYSQMLESYTKILENQNISSEQKTVAQNEIKNINDNKNKIMICENLLKTKGIEDSVIFINGDSVSVIIKSDKLEQDQIAQVQNIITREMRS